MASIKTTSSASEGLRLAVHGWPSHVVDHQPPAAGQPAPGAISCLWPVASEPADLSCTVTQGEGLERCLGYPVDDSWFMLGNQVRFRCSWCVQGGAGLLASLLEPVSLPAVGVQTMTKVLLVPLLWGILTPEAVGACRSLCAGRDMAFRKVGVLKLGFLGDRVAEALKEAAPDQRHLICTLTLT